MNDMKNNSSTRLCGEVLNQNSQTTSGSVLSVGISTRPTVQCATEQTYFLSPMVDCPTWSNIQQGTTMSEQNKGRGHGEELLSQRKLYTHVYDLMF